MLIHVDRLKSDNDATLSIVSVNGGFECFGLEDEYRADKVAGETRIPEGRYKVGVRDVGGFHGRYSAKFPSFHKGMLQVLNVPGFEYILIHIGNTDEGTAGCLLVGQNGNTAGELTIGSSTNAYKELYQKCIQHAIDGDLWIQYRDLD
jgi:hypothetical protein